MSSVRQNVLNVTYMMFATRDGIFSVLTFKFRKPMVDICKHYKRTEPTLRSASRIAGKISYGFFLGDKVFCNTDIIDAECMYYYGFEI